MKAITRINRLIKEANMQKERFQACSERLQAMLDIIKLDKMGRGVVNGKLDELESEINGKLEEARGVVGTITEGIAALERKRKEIAQMKLNKP